MNLDWTKLVSLGSIQRGHSQYKVRLGVQWSIGWNGMGLTLTEHCTPMTLNSTRTQKQCTVHPFLLHATYKTGVLCPLVVLQKLCKPHHYTAKVCFEHFSPVETLAKLLTVVEGLLQCTCTYYEYKVQVYSIKEKIRLGWFSKWRTDYIPELIYMACEAFKCHVLHHQCSLHFIWWIKGRVSWWWSTCGADLSFGVNFNLHLAFWCFLCALISHLTPASQHTCTWGC